MSRNEDDISNPYQASDVVGESEKDVPKVRFFRAEPTPKKITYHDLDSATYHAFMANKGRFIGLGVAQILFFLVPTAVAPLLIEFLVAQDDTTAISVMIINSAVLCLNLLAVFILIASINATLRLLRGEKMTFLATPGEGRRFFWTAINCFLYFLICFVLFCVLPYCVCVIPMILIGLDERFELIWIAVLCIVLLPCVIFVLWGVARHAIGIEHIVDRQANAITTFKNIRKFTKGNAYAFCHSFVYHYFVLGILTYITLGLFSVVAIPYMFCWLTVAYLMMTGQGELLSQQPDEW